MITDTHKRGDSFSRLIDLPAELPDGHFVGWAPSCQVRDGNNTLLSDLTCDWVDAETTRQLRVKTIVTTHWPVGQAEMDVQFVRSSDGWTVSTNTHKFSIIRDATKP